MPEEAEFATPEELVKIFKGLHLGTLANLRCARRGPKYYRFNRRILYKICDVRKYIERLEMKTLDQRD